MLDIYFWRNAIGDATLIEEHKTALQKLLSGQYATGDLEKLKGHRIYSFRLNKKGRLLFTDHIVNGEQYMLVLEHLPNHEYESSQFLKNGVLEQFREREAKHLAIAALTSENFIPLNEHQNIFIKKPEPQTDVEMIPLDYYNEQFIQLSSIQDNTRTMALPLVISGIAGSGKSSTLMSLAIEQALLMNQVVLYVTQSPKLIEHMKKNWEKHPRYHENPNLIIFHTYNQLVDIPEPNPDSPSTEVEALSETSCDTPHATCRIKSTLFSKWYEEYLDKEHTRIKLNTSKYSAPVDLTQPLETTFREFRICSGYTREQYIDIGKKKSGLLPDQRIWLYQAYEQYIKYLADNQLSDPSFQKPEPRPERFYRVFVDEAHDFSQLQLDALLELAENHAIVYCIDSHQMLYDNISIRAHLIQRLFDKLGHHPSHIELAISYRCPANITQAVNWLFKWKHQVVGLTDKFEAKTLSPDTQSARSAGCFHVINPEGKHDHLQLQQLAQKTNFAVITHEGQQQIARKWFKKQGIISPLIFTAEEIKGLEYDTIVVFNMFSDKLIFDRISEKQGDITDIKTASRRKKSPSDDYNECDDAKFLNTINELIISFTRTTNALIICNERTYFNKSYLDIFKSLEDTSAQKSTSPIQISTPDEWLTEAIKLHQRGLHQHSQNIFDHHLGEVQKQTYLALTKPQQQPTLPGQETAKKPTTKPKATSQATHITASKADTNIKQKTKPSSELEKVLPEFTIEKIKTYLAKHKKAPSQLQNIIFTTDESLNYLLSSSERTDVFILFLKKLINFKEEKLARIFIQKLLESHSLTNACTPQIKKIIIALLEIDPNLLLEDGIPDFLAATQNMILLKKYCELLKSKNSTHQPQITPIIYAAIHDNTHLLKCLYELGENINQANVLGCTPTYVAAQMGHHLFVEELAKLGANLNATTIKNDTAAHIAAQMNQPEVLKILHKYHADLNRSKLECHTPAVIATKYNKPIILKTLHELGVNILQPMEGVTLMHIAAKFNFVDILKQLYELGANINATDMENHATPLFVAAFFGNEDAVKYLIQINANIDIPSKHGATPKSIAQENGYTNIVKIFNDIELKKRLAAKQTVANIPPITNNPSNFFCNSSPLSVCSTSSGLSEGSSNLLASLDPADKPLDVTKEEGMTLFFHKPATTITEKQCSPQEWLIPPIGFSH